ncbi:flagellin N-terminal helical domain-containing protein [Devosia sp. SL43]|uniref:flagellin N-terminal helical domain-containing protein n=1 Tax=Devosia sp. SL43 TaxID=2806348 RepID=UPI001F3B033D|nr:flagellin [Devosia sp. SL43]UJW86645.1 flagellar protein [Devosia sp. SL43]
MSDISLSKAVRSNLLSLQNTAEMMGKTQERLASGNKVNSALDNPTNFFTAASLNSRAGDLNSLMDSMANGIQTLEAADNGLTSITKTLESMQSTLRQARQDKTFLTSSYTVPTTGIDATDELTFGGGQFGIATETVELAKANAVNTGAAYAALDFYDGAAAETMTFDLGINGETPARSVSITATGATTLSVAIDGGTATTFTIADQNAVTLTEMQDALNAAFDAAGTPVPITVGNAGGALTFTGNDSVSNELAAITVTNLTTTDAATLDLADFGFNAGGTATLVNVIAKTVDELVSEINRDTDLRDKIRASNDNGKLRIENLSTQELEIDGITSGGVIDGTTTGGATIGGNTVRADLADQFNELRDQLDKLSDDASFNGINLLRGDNLKITFNETGTSDIDIQTKDGEALNSANLAIFDITAVDLDSDTNIDAQLATVKTALSDVRSQSSAFGSNLSIVQNRQDFTKEMINTLETGAANLTLADMNEEAANLLALQTRQSLSSSSLSLASQADQSVLQLLQ